MEVTSNHASFGALLYREYLLARKTILLQFTGVFYIMLLGILVALSMQSGNLADHPELAGIFGSVRYLGLFAAVTPLGLFSDIMAGDETRTIWKLYRRSMPVSPWRLSLVKYTSLFIANAGSVLLAVMYDFVEAGISKRTVGFKDLALIVLINVIMLLFVISFSISLQITGSMDKAGIMTIIALCVIIFPIAVKWNVDSGTSRVDASDLMIGRANGLFARICESFPYTMTAFVLLYVIGFVLTAFLYRRRGE